MTRLASRGVVTIALSIALSIAFAASGSAQPTDQPETTGPQRPQSSLDATVDLFGAIDRALGSSDDASTPSDGRTYWGGNSQLTYEKTSGRFSFGADANASVRHLTDVTDGLLPSYSGSLRAAGPMTRRTSWDLQQSFAYGPTNAVPFFAPGDLSVGVQPTLPIVDYRLTNSDQLTSGTRGSVNYAVSRRGSLTAFAGYDRAGAPDSATEAPPDSTTEADGSAPVAITATGGSAFQRWDIGGRYTNRVTRYMSWYAGYGVTENSVGESSAAFTSPRSHSVDVGISYGRPLSFSRRTRISTQFGSTVLQARESGSRQWRANGYFGLRHELGRTWQAQIAYQRDTQYVPAFADPLLSDAVSVGVNGSLTRKSSLSVQSNYATGSVGISSTGANGYKLAAGSASYRYAILTQLAAYFEYFLFDADFDRDVTLTDALIGGSRRHGVRVGISIGTGLWGNRRRAPVTPSGESTQ